MQALSEYKAKLEQQGHRTLMFMLLLMNLVNPFVNNHAGSSWILDMILILVLLAAVRTVASQRRQLIIVLVIGITALLSNICLLIPDLHWLQLLHYISTLVFLFLACGLLLNDIVLRSKEVTLDVILGAVNVYLMIGVGFAFTFALIEFLQPGSFTGLDNLAHTPNKQMFFLYFSFITLSTLGYGDISPLTPVGMTTAYVEAIFGQLYLAILVARLVAMYISHSATSKNPQDLVSKQKHETS